MLIYFILGILVTIIVEVIIQINKNNDTSKKKNNNNNTYYSHTKKRYPVNKQDSKKEKGNDGELFLLCELEEKIPGNKFLLKNLYTINKDDSRSEIDVLMIHESGFYVIESKNYSGYIYGDRYGDKWTQCFYQKNKKYSKQFINPIHQNYGHIESLKEMLSIINKDYFKSYIAFGSKAHINKVRSLSTENLTITNYNDIVNWIIEDISNNPKIFTPDQLTMYYNKLKLFCHKDDDITNKHIENIKEKHPV